MRDRVFVVWSRRKLGLRAPAPRGGTELFLKLPLAPPQRYADLRHDGLTSSHCVYLVGLEAWRWRVLCAVLPDAADFTARTRQFAVNMNRWRLK